MEEERDNTGEEQQRLGTSLHTFVTKQRSVKASKRAYEISGAGGAVLVPVGIAAVEGVLGTILAVFGGLVVLAAYLLSTRQAKRPPPTKIEVFERGLVCSQGPASREILWNEVVDIGCKKIETPDGTPSVALVFETVGAPPLLIMVGGAFSDESETAKLLSSLRDAWMPVWCRRACVLAQHDGVQVGLAMIRCDCVKLGDRELAWSAITGVSVDSGVDCLETTDGIEGVEGSGVTSPFPSAARRIAALAASPPKPLLLPPAKGPSSSSARRK
jgi:hypothetical protein